MFATGPQYLVPLFLCEIVEGIELFIDMVYLINSCFDFSVIILAKLGKHYELHLQHTHI